MYPYDNTSQSQLISQMLSQSTNGMQMQQPKHIVKVNGRAGAENYQLPANSDDILLDLNDPIIYFVQTDGAGYKTITPYDISPHKVVSPQDQFKSLEERISKLEEAVNNNGKSNFRPNGEKPRNEQRNDAGSRSNDKG